jgi:hypothetical protein
MRFAKTSKCYNLSLCGKTSTADLVPCEDLPFPFIFSAAAIDFQSHDYLSEGHLTNEPDGCVSEANN